MKRHTALSQLKTGECDTKILEDQIPVMAIFDQQQTQDGNARDDSDEDDSDNQWKPTNERCPYVPAVFATTKFDKKHPPTL